jgi:hypothetical protein
LSAPNAIAFVGLRFELKHDEIEALEGRRDRRQVAARQVGLATYWGKVSEPDQYVLLVGLEVANVSPENALHAAVGGPVLTELIGRAAHGLRSARLDGEVRLHLQFFEDT